MSGNGAQRGGWLSTRLFLNLLPLVLMLLGLGVYAVVLFYWLATSVNVEAMKHYQSVAAAQSMSLALARMQGAVWMAFEEQRELGRQYFEREQKVFDQNLAVQQTNTGSPEEQVWGASLAESYHAFVEAGRRILDASANAKQRETYQQKFYPAMAEVTALLAKVSQSHQAAIMAVQENSRAITHRVTQLLLIGLAAALALASYACYRISCSILTPIKALTHASQELGKGRLEVALPTTSPIRELGELATAFQDMARQLLAYRQSTTDQMMRMHQTMEATLASFPDPIFVLDPHGAIQLANPAAGSMVKALALREELPPGLRARTRHALKSGENFLPDNFREVLSFRLEGVEKFYLPRILTMRSAEHLLGIAVVLYDVTRFRLLDDAKSNLVGTVSHELKTPLTGMRLALHLLLESAGERLNARQQELLQTARQDAERMLRTLNNLLDLARLDAAGAELDRQEVDPEKLVAEVVGEMQEIVSARQLRLVTSVAAGLPPVWVDRQRLSHVFANFISNALNHSPDRGTIRLSAAHTQAGHVEFRVADEGPGVPEEFRSRIFDRFFRVPGQKRNGAGLGLSIAREIVVAHGGQLGVRPGRERGSEFYFTLPPAPPRRELLREGNPEKRLSAHLH